MKDLINEYLDNKAGVEIALKAYVQDLTIPLDERWEQFARAGLGETDGYIYHGLDHIEEDIFTDSGRYETIILVEALEELEDNYGEYNVDTDEIYTPLKAQEKLTLIKEQVLKDFIWSFQYAW